ncbi:MAG TPA: cytochrome b/b6 domain-containing protein [Magnetospirillaceae bacterium]|jgi:cytochrome b
MNDSEKPSLKRAAVWDLPTRLFHWLLVALFVALWVTGTNDMLDWHMVIGQILFALLLFRLAWGLVGSRHSRFADFAASPKATLKHLREVLRIARRGPVGADGGYHLGHIGLGAWMVIVLLVLVLAQTISGLFATDDIATQGPLNHLVGDRTARVMTVFHDLAFNVILALVAIHIAAVLFYLIRKRENLIRPMITGSTPLPAEVAAREPHFASIWIALALLIAAFLVVWGITSL